MARTNHTPLLGKYNYPEAPNHPWIDRACVVENPGDKTPCLVLYQDKINSDVSGAVEGLNCAADKFKEEGMTVLCIANAIDAGNVTRIQENFRHPYVLICEQDLPTFYTPTFAPAIKFVRTRHELNHPSKRKAGVEKEAEEETISLPKKAFPPIKKRKDSKHI